MHAIDLSGKITLFYSSSDNASDNISGHINGLVTRITQFIIHSRSRKLSNLQRYLFSTRCMQSFHHQIPRV
jgi:hypothetical protein